MGVAVQPDELFAGGGELGALMRAFDWSATPLGPAEAWSPALRMMVRFLLANRFPLLLWWGPQYISIYNDAYRPVLGTKHPWALGQPVSECWREIWHVLKPLIDTPFHGGPATWDDDIFLEINRYGFVEEAHFTIAYSPVPDDTVLGGIGGVLATVHEITEKVVGERRVVALRDLGARVGEARTAAEACAIAAETLAAHASDVPFALFYLIDADRTHAHLAGAAGVGMGEDISSLTVNLREMADDGWPFAEALRTGTTQTVRRLHERFAGAPPGPWSDPPNTAVVMPIPSNKAHEPAGLLVAGVSARLKFDEYYQDFLDLVRTQIAAAIGNARAYEEERQRAESLAELDRAKTRFFSNISHEFRTPLTLLLGPLEDALLAVDGATEQRERLLVAQRNALRLLRLVNTLLDFSRIEAGRIQASYEPTDLPAYTAELASTFRSAIERAGLQLRVDCPPLPTGVETYVDREQWEKIVLNLLSNAFKFTFAGEIAVSLRAVDDGAAVALAVRDTGTGITAAELPRLFERFHRIQGGQSRTHEGSGIGLALVRELVTLHGGAIAVTSTPGAGSTFTVTIPTGAAHLPPDQLATSERSSTAASAAPYVEEALRWLPDPAELTPNGAAPDAPVGGRVLLADDNADMRQYVARLLGQRYTVETAPDGAAALAAALAQPPDLVLTDVMMPRLDGFQLLRALRADPRTSAIPVILLSARAGEEAQVEGLDTGADDYLVKPFAARELLARVGAHLALAQARAAARQRDEAERERLRALFEQAQAAICLLEGSDHVYTLANPRYLALIDRQDVLGKPVRAVFPELAGQGILEMLDDVYQTGQAFVGDELLIRLDRDRDGVPEDCYFNFIYAPFRGASGAVTGIFAHGYEVTEQVRARQRLEAEIAERQRVEARLASERAVLELIARGVPLGETLAALARAIEADLAGALCSILRLDQDGVHLRHGAAPSLPDEYNRAIDGLAIGPAAGSCGTTAYRNAPVVVTDIATDPLWANWRDIALAHDLRACWSTPIRGADGQVLGTFAVYYREPHQPTPRERELVAVLTYLAAIAITRAASEEQRTELLAAEQAARERAEAAVRARDEFLSIAAHELRTPVTTIKGAAQLALRLHTRGTLELARAVRAVETIHAAVDRLTVLIADLLDVSRLESGQLALRPERLDLVALAREVADRFAAQLGRAYRLEIALPAAPLFVEADAVRLEQVLDNLLTNAVKYSPDGGAIAVAAAPSEGGVVVTVRDSGIGLPPGAAERIFEPFGRAANATRNGLPGMGLGLHISRRIAMLHGGRLWAESAGEGQGTALRLWLPAK
ncbi:MAG TPA: ATP-binding protein [Thermomicrobiales bacterium]|nr:ATP-binding protein [Thermomicrobiales bacterium]